MAEFVSDNSKDYLDAGIKEIRINRHFNWLMFERELVPGNRPTRHLFDGSGEFGPLRTSEGIQAGSTAKESVPEFIRPHSEVTSAQSRFVQSDTTRIAKIIRHSLFRLQQRRLTLGRMPGPVLPSPLAIVLDFLTIPEVPGSRAYALLPVRNLLYESFVPRFRSGEEKQEGLTVDAIGAAYSQTQTYLRRRYESAGSDSIPHSRGPGAFVRHFLAMNEVFLLKFRDAERCLQYLTRGALAPDKRDFEFYRSPHLAKLPELEEVINSTIGLPLPIRGAETLFRGGIRFPASHGLVVALHGGPGTGKTTLSLAIGASLAPFGIPTIFFTAEEKEPDLRARAHGVLPAEVRRLPFVDEKTGTWLEMVEFEYANETEFETLHRVKSAFRRIELSLRRTRKADGARQGAPLPCRAVIVLDGLHGLFVGQGRDDQRHKRHSLDFLSELREFVSQCRKLEALVILTTGTNWKADESLDYLVDTAIHLTHTSFDVLGSKPERHLNLLKTRHQFCAAGAHGIQISGEKGVRFTPQMGYQIDRRSIWSPRLPDQMIWKNILAVRIPYPDLSRIPDDVTAAIPSTVPFLSLTYSSAFTTGVRVFRGSNVFLHGEGSGGKAAMALKLAISPSFTVRDDDIHIIPTPEKILVVSFLYPEEYYNTIIGKLKKIRDREYRNFGLRDSDWDSTIEVEHLYPGNIKPDALFNRIEWKLRSAELNGIPYTSVIIDGIHNVFLQFPEIEAHSLFWPQLYSMLRTRDVNIITTHTLLSLKTEGSGERTIRIDDRRSDPLRHALVQKTDFRFDVNYYDSERSAHRVPDLFHDISADLGGTVFEVQPISAIGQSVPWERVLWSREKMVFFAAP